MKLSETPPFPTLFSPTPCLDDSSRLFEHPPRPGRWIVSPTPDRWVVYLKVPKLPVGWEDLRQPAGRALRTFEPE